jgi:thymidylate synthase
MHQYHTMVKHILETGTRKENRTGVDTLSTWGEYYEHDMADGFPLLTTKRIDWRSIVIENLWFLSGSNRSEFLERHGCHFWRPWYNEDGTVKNCYGPAWRHFGRTRDSFGNDQIAWVLSELRRSPMSRRLLVSAWEPDVAQTAPLPPCHVLWALNVQNMPEPRLCLHITQRSCDFALGVPYNMAGYGFILSLMAHFARLRPGILAHTLLDAHVYTSKPDGSMAEYDHVPGLREQLSRPFRPLPSLKISSHLEHLPDIVPFFDEGCSTDEIMQYFVLEGYEPHSTVRFKVAV